MSRLLTFQPFHQRRERAVLLQTQTAIHLVELSLHRDDHFFHRQLTRAVRSNQLRSIRALQTGIENNRTNVSPRQRKLFGKKFKLQLRTISVLGNNLLPDLLALLGIRQRKVDDVAQATEKRFVEIFFSIRSEDRESFETFHSLQQVTDLE